MLRNFDAIELGATLYVSATHKNIKQMLQLKKETSIKVFIRPRSIENFKQLLHVNVPKSNLGTRK